MLTIFSVVLTLISQLFLYKTMSFELMMCVNLLMAYMPISSPVRRRHSFPMLRQSFDRYGYYCYY